MRTCRYHHAAFLILAGSVMLMSCGGGGGGEIDTPPIGLARPTVSTGLGLKQFIFDWSEVNGASYYRVLESKDASSAPEEIWRGTQTTYAHSVPLYDRLRARYLVESCNDAGCAQSSELTFPGTLVEAIGYFKASDSKGWDTFGFDVALSDDGKTLVVGAQQPGLIYIFLETDGIWSEQQKITSLATTTPGLPSLSVTISGNGNVLAAFSEGSIHIFERAADVWQEQASISVSPDDPIPGSRVPIALSKEGTFLAAGVNGDAYLYEKGAASWVLQTVLPGEGGSLTLSADANSLASISNIAPAVNIHTRALDAWTLQQSIPLNLGSGTSLSFTDQGNMLAIGASQESSSGQGINGDENNNGPYGSGAVFVYIKQGDSWTRQAYIKASNADGYDRFGLSVDLSADGTFLVVGAYGEDGSAAGLNGAPDNSAGPTDSDGGSPGAAYVFKRSGSIWTQLAYLKPSAAATDDVYGEEFGRSVAISGNGAVVAVGNDYEASSASGIGGDATDNSAYATGAVFLY